VRSYLALPLLLAALAGGYGYLNKFQVPGLKQGDEQPPAQSASADEQADEAPAPPLVAESDTIRIGTFNIQVFGQSKLGEPKVMEILAQVARRFDVLAIQEIRSKQQDVLPRYVELINAEGGQFDFVIGERLGRTSSKEQYAYVFNTQRVEIDRTALYTVGDPGDRLHREPLVAAFRVRGPPPNQAFTFTLINIHTDPDEVDTELDALDDVFLSVRNDRRGEDDVILLGDLNADPHHFGELGSLSGVAWVLEDQTTNTRGTKSYDNIVFHAPSTVEYTGRSGVLDLMQQFDLTMDEALDVSDHLPVWADFYIQEGAVGRRVAAQPGGPQAQ